MPHPIPDDAGMREFIAINDRYFPPDVTDMPIAEQRARYDRYCADLLTPLPAGVRFEDIGIAADAPARVLMARRYRPPLDDNRDVAILYLHGGGFIVGGLDSHHDICAELCLAAGTELVALDYRLAPEHVHPAQLDDTLAAYLWLAGQGRAIVAVGDSAGGNLVAALALRCKSGGLVMPVGQVLVYPGLGGDMTRGSYVEMGEAPLLTTRDVAFYHAARLGPRGKASVDAAPLAARDFAGLPPAALVSADIDPLRDDCRDYRDRLAAVGVAAVWRNEPELLHGYLRARRLSTRAEASFHWICEMTRRLARRESIAGCQ